MAAVTVIHAVTFCLASVCHACDGLLEMGALAAPCSFSGYPLGVVQKHASQQGVHVSELVLPALEYLLRGG